MASCTKVVATTSAVMKLLEMGKLRLFDTVSTFLPDYQNTDITIFDLMTHTSGLPEALAGCWTMNREQIIDGVMKLEKKYPKNSEIAYSDAGYLTLGLVVEKISGMDLNEFTKKYIFEPLEMFDTHFLPTDVKRCAPTEDRGEFIDRGYVHDEMAHNMGGIAGHAGLFSTVKDINHFIEMVLNGGTYKGKKVFDKRTIDLLFVPQVEMKTGVCIEPDIRGLGWIIKSRNPSCGDYPSKETILHTGFTGTNIFIDRANGVGFVMLSNRVHPTRKNLKLMPFRSRISNYIYTHLDLFK